MKRVIDVALRIGIKVVSSFLKVSSDAHHVHSFEHENYEDKGVTLAESRRFWDHMWS